MAFLSRFAPRSASPVAPGRETVPLSQLLLVRSTTGARAHVRHPLSCSTRFNCKLPPPVPIGNLIPAGPLFPSVCDKELSSQRFSLVFFPPKPCPACLLFTMFVPPESPPKSHSYFALSHSVVEPSSFFSLFLFAQPFVSFKPICSQCQNYCLVSTFRRN